MQPPAYPHRFRLATLGLAGLLAAAAVRAQTSPPAVPLSLLVADSELVHGSTLYGWDTPAFVAAQGGYLARYNELVDGQLLSGAAIVDRVAREYNIGPRVLLALLELRSGWVRQPSPGERSFPLGERVPGLYAGLSAAAQALEASFTGYRQGTGRSIGLAGGATVAPRVPNAGTFAVLDYLTRGSAAQTWAGLEAPSRFHATWTSLFGDPLFFQVEETLPAALPALELALPFAPGELWYYAAGPHSPSGPGGARAAVDFAPPPAAATGCLPAVAWVTAAAPGLVTRSDAQGVVVDTDDDGFDGTGWSLVYRHLATVDRVAAGTRVRRGDRLGHPSCEGGLPTQTRVSLARRFNGEWVAAEDPRAPLILGGWTAVPGPQPGSGFLLHPGVPPRVAGSAKQDGVNGVLAAPVTP
jgi:hypothetical protein